MRKTLVKGSRGCKQQLQLKTRSTLHLCMLFLPRPSPRWDVHTNNAAKTRKKGIYILTMFAFMCMSEQKGSMGTHLKRCSVTNDLVLSSKS